MKSITKYSTLILWIIFLVSSFFYSCANQIAKETVDNHDRMIHGFTAKGFEPVREAFLQNFIDGKEIGVSLCIYRNGEKIVDIWGGYSDHEQMKLWQENTMALTYSMTKGLASLHSKTSFGWSYRL